MPEGPACVAWCMYGPLLKTAYLVGMTSKAKAMVVMIVAAMRMLGTRSMVSSLGGGLWLRTLPRHLLTKSRGVKTEEALSEEGASGPVWAG